MENNTHQEAITRMQGLVNPWYQALENPASAQENVLINLLNIYKQSEYGSHFDCGKIGSYQEYCQRIPIKTYGQYQPFIQQVMEGETHVLLNEEPIGWAITRGTTKGENKFIPMTPTDMKMRVSAGRAVVNYALKTKRLDIFQGINLNLNFPSKVGIIKLNDKEIEYGYSSGIYTKYVSRQTPVRSLPTQDEIDALGGGKTMRDWEKRFDLAYQKCSGQNVTLVGGVAPTALQFGRYLRKKYHQAPKDIWNILIMTLGSVPGINTRLADPLLSYYGDPAIREIYGATEGMFGQQLDKNRAWSPNYDLFLFEIRVGSTIKPLHKMKPGEIGSLIVSTPVLARYEIGDLILAFKPPYFRTIGRKNWQTPLKYAWHEFSTFNLGRL